MAAAEKRETMPLVDAGATALVPALILLAAAVVITASRIDAALNRGDGEKLFWVGMTGLLTALLALAWAISGSPSSGPWLGAASLAGAALAVWWVRRRHQRRLAARVREERRRRISAIERRHDAVLLSWSSYELDGWKALEKPGLADAHKPETKHLIGAMRTAAALRPADDGGGLAEKDITDYGTAVAQLEEAWEHAEDTAGGGQAA